VPLPSESFPTFEAPEFDPDSAPAGDVWKPSPGNEDCFAFSVDMALEEFSLS
jgi:hypothetical protein